MTFVWVFAKGLQGFDPQPAGAVLQQDTAQDLFLGYAKQWVAPNHSKAII